MIKIEQLKKLKKGDKIKINNENYVTVDFDIDMQKDGNDFVENTEIILNKIGEKPKVLLPQKYALKYNEKIGNVEFLRMREESIAKSFPNDFLLKNNSATKINYEPILIKQ